MNVKIVIASKNVSIIMEDTAAHVIMGIEETQTIQKDVMVSNKEHSSTEIHMYFFLFGFSCTQ